MRTSKWGWLFFSILLMLLVGIGVVAQQTSNQQLSQTQYNIAVMLNSIKSRFRASDKCALTVTFANLGSKAAYVPKMENPSIEVRDASDNVVIGDPVLVPGPPPVDYYMREGRQLVLMDPVWKLEGLGGVVKVIPDALERYREHLKKGTYSVALRIKSIDSYAEDVVVRRKNLQHKLWVKSGTVSKRLEVLSNTITVEIE